MLADGDPGTGALLDQRSTGQMIGVDMGFENPFDCDALIGCRAEQFVDGPSSTTHWRDRNPALDQSPRHRRGFRIPDEIADTVLVGCRRTA